MVIKHHGVDGQQWGVRNGPPYPLDRKGVKKVFKKYEKLDKKKRKLDNKIVSINKLITDTSSGPAVIPYDHPYDGPIYIDRDKYVKSLKNDRRILANKSMKLQRKMVKFDDYVINTGRTFAAVYNDYRQLTKRKSKQQYIDSMYKAGFSKSEINKLSGADFDGDDLSGIIAERFIEGHLESRI